MTTGEAIVTAEAIGLAFVFLSSIAVFVVLHREHKRNRPRQDDEER
jgi:hypothetical protein